jgi:L-2-hydroxyglutarate oxidase LhgO
MKTYDVVVVGAGIVGLAAAREILKRRPTVKLALLEKEDRPGVHASGRNSGVLHAGVYYGADTLKAKFCSRGAAAMRAFAQEHGIRCDRSGKLVVAAGEKDLPALDKLFANSRANGVRVERLDEKQTREVEPHAHTHLWSLYSPDTAVIDAKAVVQRLAGLLSEAGAEIRFGAGVTAADPAAGWVEVAGGERIGFGLLVNAAGAYADRVARLFGLAEEYTLVPFKGWYHQIRPEREHLVRANIYPVPDLELPFLGVHLTRTIDGHVYAGPTATPALGREHYRGLEGIEPVEAFRVLMANLAMYVANHQNFRRLVHEELAKYRKSVFVGHVRRLMPELGPEDLVPCAKAGIRPQLVHLKERRLVLDFLVERGPRSVHVLNAISPAFTSAFPFAEHVADVLDGVGSAA